MRLFHKGPEPHKSSAPLNGPRLSRASRVWGSAPPRHRRAMSRGIMAMVLECSNADGLTYDLDKMKKRVLELNDTQLSLYRKARRHAVSCAALRARACLPCFCASALRSI